MNFNSLIQPKESIANLFKQEDGGYGNAMNFFLLDDGIVKAIKMTGLHQTFMRRFHELVQEQQMLDYDRKDYTLALDFMYTRLDARALMKRGQRFVFKK